MKQLLHFLLFIVVIVMPCADVSAQQYVISVKQRLVRTELYAYRDSAMLYASANEYKYGGKRGSVFVPLWQSHVGYGYVRFVTPLDEMPFAHLPFPYQDFYTDYVQYDTLYDYYDINDTARLERRRSYEDSAMTQQFEKYDGSQPIFRRNVSYGDDGRLQKLTFLSRQQGSDVDFPIYSADVYYDGRGNVVADTINFNLTVDTRARTYGYDSAGRVASMKYAVRNQQKPSWTYLTWTQFNYDSQGRLVSTIELRMDDSSKKWETNMVEAFKYDAENHLVSWGKTFFYFTSRSTEDYLYHFNAVGELDTISWIQDGKISGKEVFFNNSYHNPDSVHYYSNILSQFQRALHTYELYNDTLDIIYPPANSKRLVLYPNPASDKITIRWNKEHPHRAVNVTLYNALGQFMRRRYINDPQDEEDISLAGLATGTYIMRIMSATGGLIYTGNVLVTH